MTEVEKPVELLYRVVINLREHSQANDKKQAIKAFWDAIHDGLENRTISTYQQIETTCWIEYAGDYLFGWYQARDHAYDQGWVIEGKWQN